nr:MAG TPA: hypothetical protein [Caudoviricetes sp.]
MDKNPKIFANYIYLLNFFFTLELKKKWVFDQSWISKNSEPA